MRPRSQRARRDDHSYVQFVGLDGNGTFSRIDLRMLGNDFEISVYPLTEP